ncbi:C-type lectin domain family 4 member G-like isoform X2 [Clupea harengus]|nr:C-type lectin domain family 4 member G-like isoform X2 [Clupea harengus]XP_042564283.1 C-type lectin domain family 4 member G-like isoform X2 [Clupea harengus]
MSGGETGLQERGRYEDFNGEDQTLDDLEKVSLFTARSYGSSDRYRLATGILGLACAALLMAVISMAVLKNGTNENQSSFNITGMRRELELLRDNNATLTAARLSLQYDYDIVHWEYYQSEHQFLRYESYCSDLLFQIETLEDKKKEQELRIDQIERSCLRCPPGWDLLNDTCYYFPISSEIQRRGWDEARADCTKRGADLAIVDTLEKQIFIAGVLQALHDEGFSYRSGYWIGLRDKDTEGTWKWTTGSLLSRGYWMDGEPNDDYGYEDCVATYPTVNPLKSWNDVPCRHPLKWICAKGPQPVTASLDS